MSAVQAPDSRPWPDPEPHDLAVPAGMARERFRAMGTTISVLLPFAQAGEGTAAVRALFARWEQTLSRFLPESELSVLNRHTGAARQVSPLLFDVVSTAIDAAQATDGLFDPTLLHQMVNLGYDRSFEILPRYVAGNVAVVWPGGGWRGIRLDRARRSVTLPHGTGLDLGGIAKGMAVDAALAHLETLQIDTALVNAGGDLAVRGVLPGGESWPVAVPLREGTWTVALKHGALATSGVARRRWNKGNQERHHLLDPRTGISAQSGIWSASVGADSCVQAEVGAKVACILGVEEGAHFLTSQGLSGLLVQEDGGWRTAGSWPAAPEPLA